MMATDRLARRPFAARLKAGLAEGIRHAKGELTLRTVQVPQRPPQVSTAEVTRLRQRIGMSQAVFARVLNVSTKTVQSWEQGQRQPSQAALRMLQLLNQRPGIVCELVGVEMHHAQNCPR
jgi:putative transcriptional regulator